MRLVKVGPSLVAAMLVLIAAGTSRGAADWPQWRGPGRDGVAAAFTAPARWPGQLTLRWKVPVGIGHASPVVAGDRIYLLSREGEEEVLRCLDPDSGKTLWSQAHAVPYSVHPAAAGHGSGPKSTPVVADGRIFTFSIDGILSCHDARSGELRWRKAFQDRFPKTSPLFGAAMSPLVDQGLLIAHVGGHDAGALVALRVETGEEAWSWAGDGPGYASPVLFVADGVRQIVTQTQKRVVGVAAETGALLWSLPFETPYVQNIVTPVAVGDRIVYSGLEQGTTAIRPAKAADGWSPQRVWRNDGVSFYMNSPVVAGDRVCGLAPQRKGQFVCLDARTGETAWSGEGNVGDQAATLVAGDLLLHLTDGGELVVLRLGPGAVEPVARYRVADTPTWAHPVPLGGDLLIKDRSSLARWSPEAAAAAAPPTRPSPGS